MQTTNVCQCVTPKEILDMPPGILPICQVSFSSNSTEEVSLSKRLVNGER